MKKRTRRGKWVRMTPVEEAVCITSLSITSALYGIVLYKLYHMIF